MRRVALAAALLLPLLVPLRGSAAGPCLVDLEARNSWARVALPGAVAMEDSNPCHLLSVDGTTAYASDDGGRTRRRVGTAPTAAARLVASGLASGHALLIGEDGTLWRTADRGQQWTESRGFTGAVKDVTADESTANHLLAVVLPISQVSALPAALPVATGGGLYESHDDGRTFSAVTGATGLAVTAAVVDAGIPNRYWIGVGGPAGGLFVSNDSGSSFTPVAHADVTALVTSRLAGGGSEVVAATGDGLVVTRDGGTSVTTHLAGTAFRGLALEWQHPSAALLLARTVHRTSNTGETMRGQSDGLPPTCRPEDLRRDRSVPSVFLVTCADGSSWRYRSDGTDLSTTDDASGLVPDPTGGALNGGSTTPMERLGTRKLPVPGSRQDGSIAFDGSTIYYSDQVLPGVLHRMRARDGAELADLKIDGPSGITHIAYDANRDHLFVQDTATEVWDVDVRTGVGVRLFPSPLQGTTGSMSFDSATQRLLFASDHGDGVYEYDLTGRLRHQCPSLGLASLVYLSGNAEGPDIAALVATGDGLLYLESEDDTTVIRADRSCHVLAGYTHYDQTFSEAPAENDAIACDAVTFPSRTAIWLRDAASATVTAYAVDAGYCAVPSTVSVTAPASVATGGSGQVCAVLRNRAKRLPLPGLHVDLLVAGRGIGSPLTDRRGRACADYVPLAREAGGGTSSSSAKQPVLAAFLGTPAYRPASARASLLVSRLVLSAPPPPRPLVAVVPPPPPPPIAPPPPPPVQPPQPPPPGSQPQPIAQGHPGAQPGAMGQVGAANAPEDEAEAADQAADTHLMTPWEGFAVPVSAGFVLGSVVLARRRRSRVTGQSA